MTNKSNRTTSANTNANETEEKCSICTAFEYFTHLTQNNSTEDAFHDAAGYLIETIISDVGDAIHEDGMEMGWSVGYASAYQSISEELASTAKIMRKMNSEEFGEHGCKDCDCESGDQCTGNE